MTIGNGSIITVFSKLLLVSLTFIYLYRGGNKYVPLFNMFSKWNVTMMTYFAITLFWSVNIPNSLVTFQSFFFVAVCNICMFYNLSSNQTNTEILFKYMIIFSLLMAVRGFIMFGNIDSSARGEYNEEGFNLNTLGMNCAIGGLSAYYFLKRERRNRLLYLFAIIASAAVIIITGSKKALLIPLIALGIIKICHTPKRKVFTTLIVLCLATIGLYYAIMNIPFLYETIGIRMEGFINGLTGTGKVDSSSKTRLDFIAFGMKMFYERQWFGYGIASFSYLFNTIVSPGLQGAYSHNNFVELLVGGGLVALITYYSIYAYLIVRLISIIKKTKDELAILMLSIIVGFVIGHYGFVAYYDLTSNILLVAIAVKTHQWNQELKARKCRA